MLNSKYKKRWLLLALIILSIFINIYFRLNSLFLPHLKEAAKKEVYNNYKNQLYKNISLAYPDISNTVKEKLFNSLFNAYVKERKSEINNAVLEKTREFKSNFQDDRGWTYLLEVDPYRWFRRIDNFINTGYFGTSRINNEDYDNLMFAPFGAKIEPTKLHYYIGAYFYRLLHYINNKLSLMNCLALLPVVLSVIMVVAIFVISILSGISYLGSFLASLSIGLAIPLLLRTSFGWFDTDIYNIILPLIIVSTVGYSFKGIHLKHYGCLLLGGLLLGIYSSIWAIWWLIFYILLGSVLLYKLEIIIYDEQNSLSVKFKGAFLSIAILISCTYLSVLFISGFDAIKKSFSEPLSYLSLRQSLAIDNFWPSLAFTISELSRAHIEDITSGVGGNFILFGGIIGLLLHIVSKKKSLDFKEKRFLIFVLLLWLSVTLFLTRFGLRFIIFLIIPIGISFGALWDFLTGFLMKINKKIKVLFLGSIFILMTMIPINNASKVEITPLINDTWWKMLIKIKEVTPKDAIINTYWDYGDYIMSIAKRATAYDASWQHTPISYWMAKVLITQNEEEAAGILRMLNSGANRAFEEMLEGLNNDKLLAIEIINKVVLLKKDDSRILLNKYIKDKNKIDKILKLIYGTTHPAYMLVEQRMINIMPTISIIGNWDFKRLDLWQKFVKLKENDFISYAQERFGYSKKYSEDMYNSLKLIDKSDIREWISTNKYQFYTGNAEQNIQGSQNMILFDNGLAVDKKNLRSYFKGSLYGKWLVPGHLIFVTKEAIKENINKEGDQNCSVLVSEDNNVYKAILFSRPLAQSLFLKLYFMNGRGLKHFKLIHHESEKSYSIYLYKIE